MQNAKHANRMILAAQIELDGRRMALKESRI
jgi:hypothetical protein